MDQSQTRVFQQNRPNLAFEAWHLKVCLLEAAIQLSIVKESEPEPGLAFIYMGNNQEVSFSVIQVGPF